MCGRLGSDGCGHRVLIAADKATSRARLTYEVAQLSGLFVVGAVPNLRLLRVRSERGEADLLLIEADLARSDPTFATFLRAQSLHALVVQGTPPIFPAWASAVLPAPSDADFRPRLQQALQKTRTESGPKPVPRRPRLLAFGASTGGTEALELILGQLQSPHHPLPPVLITQHLLQHFEAAFVERLDRYTPFRARLADTGQLLDSGTIYVAPSGSHLALQAHGQHLLCHLTQAPVRQGHRPAVDEMFESVARICGPYALAVLLTGMGRDGAEGLQAIRASGGRTVIQDKASSVVWSMPQAALALNAAQQVVPLAQLGRYINQHIA